MDRARAAAIIDAVRAEGRTLLTEVESKDLLAAYGIPITETVVAPTPDEAVAAADRIGYPVVVKLYSHTISHKTDVGGVQLNLKDAAAVRHAYDAIQTSVTEKKGAEHFEGVTVQPMVNWTGYELILGSSIDPQFGPVLLFGMGGQLVELFKDRALGLPPLTTTLARRMMEQTKIYTALGGIRGRRGVDLEPWSSCSSASASSSPSSAGSASSTSTRCSPRRSASSPSTPASSSTIPRRRRTAAAAGDPPLPAPVRRDLDLQGRRGPPSARSGPRTSRWWWSSTARCRRRRSSSATWATLASTSGPPTSA